VSNTTMTIKVNWVGPLGGSGLTSLTEARQYFNAYLTFFGVLLVSGLCRFCQGSILHDLTGSSGQLFLRFKPTVKGVHMFVNGYRTHA
jgi:uncharacterized membrane protein YkvI